MMTPAERRMLLKRLSESREHLLEDVQSLTPEQRRYRPAPDRWSYAEIVEHLTLIERHVLSAIEKALEAAPDFSKRSAIKDQLLLGDAAARRATRFKAPESLVPTGHVKDDELLRAFAAARKQTYDFAITTSGDLRHHFLLHPALGEIDCYQCLLVLAAHCDRHRAQGKEVKSTSGFPRSSAAAS